MSLVELICPDGFLAWVFRSVAQDSSKATIVCLIVAHVFLTQFRFRLSFWGDTVLDQ